MGLRKQALATRLSKPQSTIVKYENGARRIDDVEFMAICSAIATDSASIRAKVAKLSGLSPM